MKILVTGCAGFIGSNLCDALLDLWFDVIGVDNFNDYYNPKIKESNLIYAQTFKSFKLYPSDILDGDVLIPFIKPLAGSDSGEDNFKFVFCEN